MGSPLVGVLLLVGAYAAPLVGAWIHTGSFRRACSAMSGYGMALLILFVIPGAVGTVIGLIAALAG
ncbi:MAG TPA: hypothetical protein VF457_13090 [Burkholderiaceae bacterium]